MKRPITIALLFLSISLHGQKIRVGAKHFNEGYILSEIIAQLLEYNQFSVERKYNLGGTMVCFGALSKGEIDVYPEYTGTISFEILKAGKDLSLSEINSKLKKKWNLELSEPYGFDNTYALIMTASLSKEKNISEISHLLDHADLKIGLSYEFLKREDGWENLSNEYSIRQTPTGLEHGLAYEALLQKEIDVTDAYSTDGEILRYDLKVLNDDKNFFPHYLAASLYRDDLNEKAKKVLGLLRGQINEQEMQAMNAEVLFQKKSFSEVALEFLKRKKLITSPIDAPISSSMDLLAKTGTHLVLTFLSLLLATFIAVPLGIILYWNQPVARYVLYMIGLLQTIPSIALLALLIPITGIGVAPAIVALFLYALLPIVRNTYSGLENIDPILKKVAVGMGMNRIQRIRLLELPLAAPVILTGIRTAAVINVGTATLAAFIGAGGLGEYIVTGLALNNSSLILRGAIPAALLAITIELIFEWIELMLRPAYLKKHN